MCAILFLVCRSRLEGLPYSYSFALFPEEHQPSGVFLVSRMSSEELHARMAPDDLELWASMRDQLGALNFS